MKTLKLVISTIFVSQLAVAEVSISLANGTEKEEMKRKQVLRLIEQHDLKKWWFTNNIIIDESVRSPYSHPILTLKASRPNNDPAGLSQLLHEQIHWFEDARKEEVAKTVAELRKMYPSVPVGFPNGARSEFSTYLHLAVCLMELDALTHVLGKEKAEMVVAKNGKYFYKWIYKTVLQDQTQIREVLNNNDLYIE
ncbi:hypothetical protein [Flocculibacter collagenilyticus]|uniref:hypothetical protein n=1 Tax=Flocculibacter collagenilyticus TaxID=2744479 RepID=UPI0018F64933|nr:hypothetical protein [Flocculibacter collagenilyticus]